MLLNAIPANAAAGTNKTSNTASMQIERPFFFTPLLIDFPLPLHNDKYIISSALHAIRFKSANCSLFSTIFIFSEKEVPDR